MGFGMDLSHPEFTPEWIWGDDAETTVFAQGYGLGLTVIFSFSLTQSNQPSSLANRICASFHGLETADEANTFPDQNTTRGALWQAVFEVWSHCTTHPQISQPDAIVSVDRDHPSAEVTWKVYNHPLYPRYVQHLADRALGRTPAIAQSTNTIVDFGQLVRFEQLGGHGCATRVNIIGKPANEFFVFKGIDFRTFLSDCDEEGDNTIRYLIQKWHKSNEILEKMPPHPNVMQAPTIFATVHSPEPNSDAVTCGWLQPYFASGSVGDLLERTNKAKERLPLELKAHWCANMAAAIAHTHRVARTYHMDIKPSNFIIDEKNNPILVDWEQIDAPATTLAPEADGTWDVEEENDASSSEDKIHRPHLLYTRYSGPPRYNVEEDIGEQSWHSWNVFPLWNAQHPFALELAEVFSLGRCMWVLLRQPGMHFEGIQHPNDLVPDWDCSEDIPNQWKEMVDRCMSVDPNERPDVLEVERFWAGAWEEILKEHYEPEI